MAQILRNGISFCLIDGQAVFLDLPRDRYFRLPSSRNRAFVQLVERKTIPSDIVSFSADGEFMIEAIADDPPVPVEWPLPLRPCPARLEGEFRLGEVARALWVQRRAEVHIRSRPIAELLGTVQQFTRSLADASLAPGTPCGRIVRAFEHGRLLRTAANRCLPRSLGLNRALARKGCRSHIVLGVKLGPFAAHCWVQAGQDVLNDTVEEVARYTPILVV